MNAIQEVMKIYQGKGHLIEDVEFEYEQDTPIHTVLADNEFRLLKDNLEELGMRVHIFTRKKHAPDLRGKIV
jgi:hypothetical protein